VSVITIRTAEKGDWRAFRRLLEEFKPRIAGLRSPIAYRAVFSDAFTTPNIVIIVADAGGGLVGFSVTAIDWMRYQRRFASRHPLVATASACKRLVEGLRVALRKRAGADAGSEAADASVLDEKSWGDSSPEIAKVIYTGVSEAARNRGIATDMARYRTGLLLKMGVRRVDALVSPHNTAVIRLNEKLGYRLERSGDVLLMSMELAPHEPEVRP
jgi:ribosomal protein S18 acetylase RimI-like enzyme